MGQSGEKAGSVLGRMNMWEESFLMLLHYERQVSWQKRFKLCSLGYLKVLKIFVVSKLFLILIFNWRGSVT